MTTNRDRDKYSNSGYSISFDACGTFSLTNGGFGKNLVIFGANMSYPVQGFDDTNLTAEAEYSINFTEQRKKFCLSLHYNESNNYLFVNGVQIYQFKAKDSELVAYLLCLGNI